MPEQLSLIPETPPVQSAKFLPIDALVAVSTRDADRNLIASVQALGVLQPILVVPVPSSTRYRVIDGRRRLSAARTANLTAVPVVIYSNASEAVEHVIQLASHAIRSSNPIGEFDAICALLGAGASERDIARDTGMPLGTVRARMKLQRLHPDLQRAFRAGGMAVSVAEEACKLPDAAQASLVTAWLEKDRITEKDVHAAKEARSQAAMATLNFDQMVRGTQTDTGPTEAGVSEAERLCGELDEAIMHGAQERARALVAELRGLVRGR